MSKEDEYDFLFKGGFHHARTRPRLPGLYWFPAPAIGPTDPTP